MQRLLQCSCGREFGVELSQAGTSFVCPDCETAVAVPALLELKKLAVVIPPQNQSVGFFPKRTLPPSKGAMFNAAFAFALVIIMPILVATGLFDNAFSYTAPGDLRRGFFKLDSPAFWASLALFAVGGFLSLMRGLGYRLAGHRDG